MDWTNEKRGLGLCKFRHRLSQYEIVALVHLIGLLGRLIGAHQPDMGGQKRFVFIINFIIR